MDPVEALQTTLLCLAILNPINLVAIRLKRHHRFKMEAYFGPADLILRKVKQRLHETRELLIIT